MSAPILSGTATEQQIRRPSVGGFGTDHVDSDGKRFEETGVEELQDDRSPTLDSHMPRNFSTWRKWSIVASISFMILITSLGSTIFASGVQFAQRSLVGQSAELASFSVTAPILGYLIGALVLAPASELFGRRPVLSISNWFFVVWQIGCAVAPNLNALAAFRFFAGVGGAGCVTLDAGVVADLFLPEQRGAANAAAAVGVIIGPNIAPLLGGFIAQRLGWRWIFWILAFAGVCAALTVEATMRETLAPVIKQRQQKHLTDSTSGRNTESLDASRGLHDTPGRKGRILDGFMKLLRMLGSPILLAFGLYYAFIYGLLYLLLTTVDDVFQRAYDWSPDIAGLPYIGLGLGSLLDLIVIGSTSDRIIVHDTKRNNNVYEPEMRLSHMIFFAVVVAISLFWYGWTSRATIAWIVPIIALTLFGFGTLGLMFMITIYVIDAFSADAASAMASTSILRSVAGALLPLAAPRLYASLGIGWGCSVLGFIAVALLPIPWLFLAVGRQLAETLPQG